MSKNKTMFEIRSDVPLPVNRLVELTNRIADEVKAGRYISAREAAKDEKNLVEYTGHSTDDKLKRNGEVLNLTRRIIARLAELGLDQFGNPNPKNITFAAPADLA